MKEFDIYLRKHLTECDIIVYSVLYNDDTLSVTNKMVLESCLNDYIMQGVIASELNADTEIIAHIKDMAMKCYEKLNFGTKIGATPDFKAYKTISPEGLSMQVSPNEVNVFCAFPIGCEESALQIAAGVVDMLRSHSIGGCDLDSVITSTMGDVLETVCEKYDFIIKPDSDVGDVLMESAFGAGVAIPVNADISYLCQVAHTAGAASLAIASALSGITPAIPFDESINFKTSVGADIEPDITADKYIMVQSAIGIFSGVADVLLEVMERVTGKIGILAEMEYIAKRYSMLSDLDGATLQANDDAVFSDVDFITI